ncbi:type 2 lantipeptide synthetase LanM [Chryseobacterium arthrosphaerae]|uniref:type 2 lanthipeptide synthetase LanM n=1 Tax=Chryseobacterium arthrosphaerae TaxID=651561 RepID=UPI000F4E5AA1|nr:type 2 lanthipeptide synthetase LanM [Chryseobacterium arthrosphaerae]AYZ14350.1 type 2 lantipeptide synthetase LanM [Chryseobacterium arthrosphaerae]
MSQNFKHLYLKALLPFERINESSVFIPFSGENNKYLGFWKKNIDKDGLEEQFKKYCEAVNINEDDVTLMISNDFKDNNEIKPSVWIELLQKFLTYESILMIKEKNNDLPFYDILFPLVDFSISSIDRILSDNLVNTLQSFFYKDLISSCYNVFLDEFLFFLEKHNYTVIESENSNIYYKEFAQKNISEKYLGLFDKYPMLARILMTKTYRNIQFISKLFERLEKDYNDIENKFQVKLGELDDIILNAGDKHNGETTVILKFAKSYKVVYKPTNLEVTDAFNDLLDWVGDNLAIPLKKFKIINKEEYGWMEFVEYKECETLNDIEEYYEKAGIITGLAYFLSTRDYHYENVIASGNCPVLIDHETIIGPKIKYRIKNDTKRLENSILESLLLPTDETGDREICGLGSVAQKKSKTIISPKIINPNRDTMKKVPQCITQNNESKNIPHLNNVPYHIEDYKDTFISGFIKLYHLILDNKEFLLSEQSPINSFENKKVRFLVRNTEVYFKLLVILSHPEYLKDSTMYGIKQEVLSKAYMVNKHLNTGLLKSEREQITLGDIPAFYINTLSDHLLLENGEKVDLFDMNAMQNLKNKIESASIENCNEQIVFIEESLSLHAVNA